MTIKEKYYLKKFAEADLESDGKAKADNTDKTSVDTNKSNKKDSNPVDRVAKGALKSGLGTLALGGLGLGGLGSILLGDKLIGANTSIKSKSPLTMLANKKSIADSTVNAVKLRNILDNFKRTKSISGQLGNVKDYYKLLADQVSPNALKYLGYASGAAAGLGGLRALFNKE